MLVSVSSAFRFILFSLGVFLSTCLMAQSPITVTVNILPPYPNYASEVMEMNDQTIITIQNTDISNGYSIKLKAKLTGNNGITVRTKESALPSSPIDLSAGETMVMTGEELSVFYNNYSENDFDFIGISRDEIINNQQLPDGMYTICLRAFEYQSGIPLSSTTPSGCSAPFMVLAVDPPIITYPQNNTEVSTLDPQLLSINWIPVSISLPDLRYRLEVVDLTDFPINPYDAFETGDFLFFFEDDIMANVFLYGMEHPLLTKGHNYAIRVRAYRLDGPLNVLNDGYSDIVTFTYGDEDDDITTTVVGITDEVPPNPEMPEQNFGCGQSCIFNLPSGQSPSGTRPQVGAMLDIGNFRMRVNSIQGDGPYQGEGVIQKTEFFPIGIKVKFKDIQVNSDGRVFSGSAKSVIRTDSWIDESMNDINTAVDHIHFNPNTLNEAVATLSDPSYYIDNIEGISEQVGTTLPFTMGSGSNRLQVVGMNFFPEKASYNLSSIIELLDDAEGNPRYLNFMAKNLCITPGGLALSADEARLELVKPVRYNFDNKTQLEFKPGKNGAGTYLSFDCDGFNGVWAQGKVVFSPDVIKPVDDQGDIIVADTVVAGFTTIFTSWSNWVATVNFKNQGENSPANDKNLFMYKELEGYIIGVDEAFIDHSVNANPDGMVFPDNYASNTGTEWQGVYLKTVEVTLPEWIKAHNETDGRVHLIGKDLIIDGEGLTGEIKAENVLTQKEGAMGKWPITVDQVRVKILQNSLSEAHFLGSLKIPVFDEPFDYTADLQFLANHTKHTFTFSPLEEYTIPMWYANTTITNNSSLTVNINDGSAYVEANLNGAISFQPLIGDIDKMNLANITFTNFIIRSEKAPKYIEGILLNSMDLKQKTPDLNSLDLDLKMDLSGDSYGISGSTGLAIKNSIHDLVDSLSFDFEGVDINDMYLEANAGIVNIKGGISFFKNDQKFGNGFEGNLEVDFIETIKLQGSVLFGNVKPNNGNKFNYWYAHAMAYLPTSPIPMATPLDIYGFGGGVYKNLELNSDFSNPRDEQGGAANASARDMFDVHKGMLGFQAAVIFGLTPSSTTFNADLQLTAEINTNTGGVNKLALDGGGYLMQDIEKSDKSNSMFKATVSISYDFPNKIFSSTFGVHGKVPYSHPLVEVDGDIVMYRSPTLWFLKAGTPSEPMHADVNLGIGDVTSTGYFQTGQQLEQPVIPAIVTQKLHFHSNMVDNMQNGLGIGFAAGIHMYLHVDWTLAECGVKAGGWAGVDLAVLNYFAATCNGREDFGVNKWYAQGLAYVAGEIVLTSFAGDVASFGFAAALEGAFPNPTGVKGVIAVWVDPPFFDKFKLDHDFQYGSFCNIQPMSNADEQVYHEEVVLDNLPLLGYVTPANGLPQVSTNVHPKVQFFQKDWSEKKFVYGDGMGGIINKRYRIRNEVKWQKKADDGTGWSDVRYNASMNTQDSIMTLEPRNSNGDPSLINGGSTYKIVAKSYIELHRDDVPSNEYVFGGGEDNYWVTATYTDGNKKGQPIVEKKVHQFKTGSNLTELEEMFVDYTLPYPRQRFYPYEYLNNGKIKFNVDQKPKFQDFNTCGFKIYAEFTPVDGSVQPPRQKVDPYSHSLEARFKMAALNPETIYKLQIVAERRISSLDLMLIDNPKCELPTVDEDGNWDGALGGYFAENGINIDLGNFTGIVDPSFGGPVSLGSGSFSGSSGSSSNSSGLANQQVLNSGAIMMPSTLNLGPANNGIGDLISMMNDTIVHRKILFTIYFRTSKYSTPEEKMETISVSKFYITPAAYSSDYIPPTTVQDVLIKIDSDEGFDKYDLFGHEYRTPETKEYFRFKGRDGSEVSGVDIDDATELELWFFKYGKKILPLIPDFLNPGHAPQNQAWNDMMSENWFLLPDLSDVDFEADPENYMGVKHLEPLLSDEEVGLAEGDASIGYVNMPVYGSTEMAGPITVLAGNISGSGWITGEYNPGPSSPTTISVSGASGDPELELKYNVDRNAAFLYNFTEEKKIEMRVNPVNVQYQHPPAGTYLINIILINQSEEAKKEPNPTRSRTLDITIPFETYPIQY